MSETNWCMLPKTVALLLLAFVASSGSSQAATFFGPSSEAYLSEADIPLGFYASGSPTALEDFEDGTLDFGITDLSTGFIVGPGVFRDSVDGDDGTIDGFGRNGSSYFDGDAGVITFQLPSPLPTAAGLVWTDSGFGNTGDIFFEAFGPGMVSLGQIGPFGLDSGSATGETAEDRFFGVKDAGGILAIEIRQRANFEIDHVQYGDLVPEPSSFVLLSFGVFIAFRRR